MTQSKKPRLAASVSLGNAEAIIEAGMADIVADIVKKRPRRPRRLRATATKRTPANAA